MDCKTTQKLSFLPNKIGPKERVPWAERAKFVAPNVRMESNTTNKLSFLPPGQFIEDYSCGCLMNESSNILNSAPRAAIC